MLTSTTRLSQYAGNGVTTSFPVGFAFVLSAHLQVVRKTGGIDIVQTEGVHYTVLGGNVIMTTAPLNGDTLTIKRIVPYTQLTNFRNLGAFQPGIHENALDLLTMEVQQVGDDSSSAISLATTGLATERATSIAELAALRAEILGAGPGAAVDTNLVTAFGTVTARQLRNRFGEIFNVMDFGAVGNGVTDDTSAIQAAITAATAASGNTFKTVWFPSGTYLVSAQLNITASKVALRGAGHADVALRFNPGAPNSDFIVFQTAAGQAVQNALSGMTLRAVSTNARRMLTVGRQTRFWARDLMFEGESGATYTDGAYVHSLVDCRFESCWWRDSSSHGFFLVPAVGVNSTGSQIHGCRLSQNDVVSGNGTVAVVGCVYAGSDSGLFNGGVHLGLQAAIATTFPVSNSLYKELVPKCLASVQTGVGGPTLLDGVNVASVSYVSGTNLQVTFAVGMAGIAYFVFPSIMNSLVGHKVQPAVKSASFVSIAASNAAGSGINLSTTSAIIDVLVMGRQ